MRDYHVLIRTVDLLGLGLCLELGNDREGDEDSMPSDSGSPTSLCVLPWSDVVEV